MTLNPHVSVKVIYGDALASLQTFPDQSVNCCVTSPPYFGLRDYGVSGQIGLETTPEEYVSKLVAVFREVHRVLLDDGTLWLNLGDSYCAHPGQRKSTDKASAKQRSNTASVCVGSRSVNALKPKDLIGIPWRVAFALQAAGWFLRSDIIWHKPSVMPESVRDRPTRSHEYIFLLSKNQKYFYDAEAIKEPSNYPNDVRKNRASYQQKSFPKSEHNGIRQPTMNSCQPGFKAYPTRNKRDVWTVTTANYRDAHFATFPPALIVPCVLAGCPKGGTVLDPFAGSGTVGQVAIENDRNSILVELNPEYIPLIQKRVGNNCSILPQNNSEKTTTEPTANGGRHASGLSPRVASHLNANFFGITK